jgi:formamidopyrimidine-DNA glycosylase
MPEMPEVETIARKLRGTIIGKSVAEVWLSGLPLRRPLDPEMARCLVGRTIRGVHRRGKYIIAELEPRLFWLIHLGMSGRIFYFGTRAEKPKHTHVVIRFTDSSELQYRDPRRFGLMATHEVPQLHHVPELALLGVDPLDPGLTAAWLGPMLRKSRVEIKSFLLDQYKIAGLGNIYVCEALYHARIRPRRRCFTLTRAETRALVRAIRKVILLAVRNRGTSFSDFMDPDREPGANQHFLCVFQKDGEQCRRCRSIIRRLRQGNRSSFYCPRCQR